MKKLCHKINKDNYLYYLISDSIVIMDIKMKSHFSEDLI